MISKTIKSLAPLLATTLIVQILVVAQVNNSTPRTAGPTPSTLLASLPQSDAIAQVKVKKLLTDVMPRVLANNSGKLAELNANIENFKTRTGLDPRSFDEVALSVRYTYPSEGVTKLITAALARGTFSPGAMVAAGRLATNGNYREEKYGGKDVYVFKLDENLRVFGVIDLRIRELAACPIDANTLALGDPASIRTVIDANAGRTFTNPELVSLANNNPNAVIGFGGNISPQVIKNLDIANASLTGDLSGLRQAYGSVDATEKDLEIFLGAKTVDSNAARDLGDTLEGLKQFGALFVGRLTGAKGVLAKSALTNLKILTQSNELQIRTAVAQADIGPLVGN